MKTRAATTAEQLMRSRYSAFVLHDVSYLLATWHPDTRPRCLTLDSDQRWLGLKVKRVEAGGVGDPTGVVEFVARYKIAGRGYRLHEVSRFSYIDGAWLYVDGELK